MDCTIRNAGIEDYEAALLIVRQVQRMHAAWRPDIYKLNGGNPLSKEEFQKKLDENAFFVAETDGTAAGIMEITFRHIETPFHVTRDVIYIDTLAVEEKYRGMGIGHLLLEKAQAIKAEKKLDGIELQVNAKNRAAYEMYVKYGFTEKSVNMELF